MTQLSSGEITMNQNCSPMFIWKFNRSIIPQFTTEFLDAIVFWKIGPSDKIENIELFQSNES